MTGPLRLPCYGSALFFAVVVLAAAVDARGQDLRYKFEPGEKLLYTMTQDVAMVIKAEGVPEQQMTIDQTTEMSWTIEDVQDDGTARIVQSIDRIQMNLAAPPNVSFQYDSASNEEPTGAVANLIKPILQAMIGARFTVTMDARGQIKEIQVPDSLVEAMQKVPNAAQMGEMFTKEGFEKMIRQGTLVFPEKRLEPGAEWSQTLEAQNPGLGGKQTVTTSYEYLGREEVEGRTLEAFATSQSMQFGDGATPAGGKITVKDQESNGKIYFDREAGHMKSSWTESNMTMEVAVFGTTMVQEINQSVQVDVKRAE